MIALVVIDTDGSAFITKAEFDSLKNNFQAQIDNYNSSIDSKIDGAIAAYLAGVRVSYDPYAISSCVGIHRSKKTGEGVILFLGTDSDHWYTAGDSLYSSERQKGKFNYYPRLDVYLEYFCTVYKSAVTMASTDWPAGYDGLINARFVHRVVSLPPNGNGHSISAIHIILDDNGNYQTAKANGRIQQQRLVAKYISVTATNWTPLDMPNYPDGSVGLITLASVPKEFLSGQNTHMNESYIQTDSTYNEGTDTGTNKIRYYLGRWGASSTYPQYATKSIIDPATGTSKEIGGITKWSSGYRGSGNNYNFFGTIWSQSNNTEFGEGYGIFIPSALSLETKCCAMKGWPSADLLLEKEYDEYTVGASCDNRPYDPVCGHQEWSASLYHTTAYFGGVAAYVAGFSAVDKIYRVKGFFPIIDENTFKDVKDIKDGSIYDSFGLDCPLGGAPILCPPFVDNGTLEWTNITFSNGYQSTGHTAGNFKIIFNKEPFKASDLSISGDTGSVSTIANPKKFRYKKHTDTDWSAEVDSLVLTNTDKNKGYDFKFDVTKNEKIYFGVFDENNIVKQAIVVKETDIDSMILTPENE